MPWVKILEKSLVLNFMQGEYSVGLMNYQMHALEEKIPNYEDILQYIGDKEAYQALLGCKATSYSPIRSQDDDTWISLKSIDEKNERENIVKMLKEKIVSGELLAASFLSNWSGIEAHHQYEIVNFAIYKENEFVILSNPWGFNRLNMLGCFKSKPNFSSLSMLVKYPDEQIMTDKSLIIISLETFLKNVDTIIYTENVPEQVAAGLEKASLLSMDHRVPEFVPESHNYKGL